MLRPFPGQNPLAISSGLGAHAGLLLIEVVDVRLVDHAGLFHRLPKLRGLCELPCQGEIFGLVQDDHFIHILFAAKQMLIREARLDSIRKIGVEDPFPRREILHFMSDNHIG